MRALITTDTVGGVWTFTQELTEQLIARGWAIRLVSLGGPASPSQQAWCAATARACGSTFQYDSLNVPLEWMPENQRAWQDAAPALTAMAQEFQADIVHTNQFCFGALPLQIPVLVTAHSDVLSWARACGKTLEDSAWLRTYSALVDQGLAAADAVAAPTRWMAESIQSDFRLTAPAQVIANGRSLANTNSKSNTRKLQAVTAGRLWDEAKNISLLAKVDAPGPLLIAGDATAVAGDTPNIPGNVQLLGMLAPADLHALFRESAIYICPSRYEPFGLAPLEAAQCGCALLLHDIPPLREIWQEDALYFRSGAELILQLRWLSEQPDELAAAQVRAARRARSFSAERMAEGYHALLQQLVQQAREEASPCPALCA